MCASFLVLSAVVFTAFSAIPPSFSSKLSTEVSQSPDNFKAITEVYKDQLVIEDIFTLYKKCDCGLNSYRLVYSTRLENAACLKECMASVNPRDGQVCDSGKLPLWETFGNCYEQCNGKMSTPTVSYIGPYSEELAFSTYDRVFTPIHYISPTPKPQCEHNRVSYNTTTEIATTINRECLCGNNYKIISTKYTYYLVQCAEKCISANDGKDCNMLKMPLNSFYDGCCTSCGGELWTMNTAQDSVSVLDSRVCISPLLTTPTPTPLRSLAATRTPTPTPFLRCNYSTNIKRSEYNSTNKIIYRCRCGRNIATKPYTSYTIYSDTTNFQMLPRLSPRNEKSKV